MSSENYKWYPPYKVDSSFSSVLQCYRDRITAMAWFNCSIVVRWGDLPHGGAWKYPLVVVAYDYDTRSNLPEYYQIGLPPSAYIRDWEDKPEWLKDWDVLKDIISIAEITKSDKKHLAEIGYYMSMAASLRTLMSIVGKSLQEFERKRADLILSDLDKEISQMAGKIMAIYRMDVLGEY